MGTAQERQRRPRSAVRRLRLGAAATLLTLIVGMSSCSEGEANGNEQAFCGLLADGVGLADGGVSLNDFARLNAVAPNEIRPTVNRLRNAALDLSEIDPLDVAALFNARFDPNAQESRAALESYAVSTCELDLEDGPPIPIDELSADLRTYLSENFADAAWTDNLVLAPGTTNGRLESVIARMVEPPSSDADAAEICRALSVYLYVLNSGDGSVSVEHNGEVVAFRSGPEASCTAL